MGIGYNAAGLTTTGGNNVAIGSNALYDNTTSNNQVAVGYNALQNATGGSNTAVGKNAGENITTGVQNICIGIDSNPSSASSNNQCTLGGSNITNLRCNDTSISSLSDRRDKTDIIDLTAGLKFLNSLRPRQFKWKTRDGNIKDGLVRAGFIAQELQEAQKDSDFLDLVLDDNPDKLEAKQEHLIPVLVKAIQELSAKVAVLEAA